MNSEKNSKAERPYQICTRCVMDTTDTEIEFDENDVCNHCTSYIQRLQTRRYIPGKSEEEFQKYVTIIKERSKNKKYDCIVGISGGVDSCYVAYLCKQYGLRTLLIHMDNGWDTEIAVNNIRTLAKALDFDYISYVLDWEEFRDIQLAFLRSSSVDLEMPTDVAILGSIYKIALQHDIDYIISGGNLSSEGILPTTWGYHGHKDMKMYKHIVQQYGNVKIRKIPVVGLLKESYYKIIKKIKTLYILNYIDYDKDQAKKYLMENLGWKDYGGKHHESKITAFWQGYVMYSKFNMDYRRAMYSSQIIQGQISREQAIENLKIIPFDEEKIKLDKSYIAKKYGITVEELDQYLAFPPKTYLDFPNNKRFIDFCYSLYNKYLNKKRV